MRIILKTANNGLKDTAKTLNAFFIDQKIVLKKFFIALNIYQNINMHDDPVVRLWMLQNALTTFT